MPAAAACSVILLPPPTTTLLSHLSLALSAPPSPLLPLWRRPQAVDCVKFSRANPDVQPFESGGETTLELHGSRLNCSLFAVGSHQKKRPHNLVLGRLHDFRLYDAVEFGVAAHRSVRSFGGGASLAQQGNKVCARVRVGEWVRGG